MNNEQNKGTYAHSALFYVVSAEVRLTLLLACKVLAHYAHQFSLTSICLLMEVDCLLRQLVIFFCEFLGTVFLPLQ